MYEDVDLLQALKLTSQLKFFLDLDLLLLGFPTNESSDAQ
jgi:hypothetical protein